MYFSCMYISRITLDNFRNYHTLSLELPQKGALFSGPNGCGKTNLLEAVFLLCTARSQRGSKRSELIRFSSDHCFAEGVFEAKGRHSATTVSLGFSRDLKVSMKINDRPVSSFSQWLGHGLVVSFSPDDLSLVHGMPKERRNFLDLFISQIDQRYLENLIEYKKNLAQRNILLARRIEDAQLDVFEEAMVRYGSPLFLKRLEITSLMAPHFSSLYREISGNRESAAMEYRPSIGGDSSTQEEWKNVFYKGLKNARNRDIQNGFSSLGPHRDDILLFVNEKSARSFASLGQCTTVSLALRMSSVLVSEQCRNETMIFLFDDAVSYLDTMRTSRVFPLIEHRGQILITAPSDREPRIPDIPRFSIREGLVSEL